ncbi:MAG: DNA recombination protein RmuC [Bacteroidia bacterium]|nr:DNA recombination protein RmuC [Bacteroidia bacterium]NNC85694.1 DNA recombination protein RmuC [Bacteroidia bacterium]NNM15123.1 DNA recombination protein RmuC [Bacteroidia bacterium]
MEQLYIYIIGSVLGGMLFMWMLMKILNNKGIKEIESQVLQLDKEKDILTDKFNDKLQELDKFHMDLEKERLINIEQGQDLVTWKSKYLGIEERVKEQQQEYDKMHVQLKEQFKNIATDIVSKNSLKMQEEHKVKLNDILSPFKDKIEKFEKKVDETHKENIRENQTLKEQISNLQKLNQSIGEEAKNLTRALKGEMKTQGNWGEMVLERVLEMSGLNKGREYETQVSGKTEEGNRVQPDVIVRLPDDKNLIIDSKVSLNAHEKYTRAESDEEKSIAIKEHLISVKKHIKDLSSKNYQNLYDLNTLDFVLLFIPIEQAFISAINADDSIYQYAFEKNIVIVTPSTLLAVLKTISNIWRNEDQNQNAIEIARQSGAMYDKLAALVEDLIKVGNAMDQTKDRYSSAMNKLTTGKGNLIGRAEKIKTLGAKTSKIINTGLTNRLLKEEDD